MTCDKCESKRILMLSAKCSDLFHAYIGDKEINGYVPNNLNIGGGDYVEFNSCLDCGKIQGEFPVNTL